MDQQSFLPKEISQASLRKLRAKQENKVFHYLYIYLNKVKDFPINISDICTFIIPSYMPKYNLISNSIAKNFLTSIDML